uniref:Palmitoyltransferase n=1 Tax=Kwoniella pini CBS 10737 TaxID=1296096 RepID=A0A1B9HX18_9TREE|nr:vacuolar protein [Kwoniella pini CBS 10737]OCF47816.1 vacuolar protein [Kwoniella pini CBS 10737]
MPLIHGLSGVVIRCFKKVETAADWMTGAAGPVFVFMCWSLILSGGFIYFDVVVRSLSFLSLFILSPLLILVPLNLYGQYYLVTHVPPGYPAPKPTGEDKKSASWLIPNPKSIWSGERWGFVRRGRTLTGPGGMSGTWEGASRRVRRCRKCDGPKPERTHHCSVCKRCVLQMDHHCPWINACVGLHNQRHFVLFMAWLSTGCATVSITGYRAFLATFDYHAEWPSWTPKIGFTLIYVLCLAIGFAVSVLMFWHLYMVSYGETSIESHDNAYLAGKAKKEGLIYLNPYDLGRRRNLQLFFNIGPNGYSTASLLFPLALPPASNGWSFPRRPIPSHPSTKSTNLHAPELADGLIARANGLGLGLDLEAESINSNGELNSPIGGHAEDGMGGYVMGDEEGLTDDEEGGGGWMDLGDPQYKLGDDHL